jgi:membrane protease YdiL (CAAX protease family)
MVALCAASALLSLLTMAPPVSNGLARALFRRSEPSHTLRLAARLCLLILLLGFPGWYTFKDTLVELFENTPDMFEQVGLGTGLIGYVILALAAVGFMVRRDLPATLERLGIRPLRGRDWLVIPFGIVALIGVNIGLEELQRVAFPALWESDQRISALIAGQLGIAQIIMLGLSAGIGEEITLRGALQPKLGLLLTSLMFASLHVQYSWYGMGVIFIFGLLLGIIRIRTSTSVAIGVHTLYDVIVIFAT